MTALHWAVYNKNIQIIDMLIDKGASLDIGDYQGNTPLHSAASHNYAEITRLLIGRGAPLDIKNNRDRTALSLAKSHGYHEIARMLKEAAKLRKQQAKENAKAEKEALRRKQQEKPAMPLVDAIAQGDCQQVRKIFDQAFWAQEPVRLSWDHLKIALEREDKSMMRLLITWGVTAPNDSSTPLTETQITLLRQCGLQNLPPIIGDRADDGAIYVGISPDTKKPMYAAPADEPLLMSFNEASERARELSKMTGKIYSLPSKNELNMLFNACEKGALKGTFNLSSSGRYLSSSSHRIAIGDQRAGAYSEFGGYWSQRFSDGDQHHYCRENTKLSIRLVRD